MKRINTAIIGIGHLGARHLKVYTEQISAKVNLVGVCDIQADRTQRLASHYHIPFYKNYKDLLGKVEAVNICVPTVAHFAIAKFFLENNVHTFVEKPITYTLAEADQLIDLARPKNLKLQVGHVERFNSAFESIKHFARDPLFIECHRLNKFPNRSLDIGVVMDLMIHDIDIILGLNSAPIKSIHAVGIQVLTKLEDIASVRIVLENGCVCNLTASRVSEDPMRKIRIFTKNSYISLDYMNQEAKIYKRVGPMILKHALPIEKEEPLKKELEAFIDCVRDNKKPLVSGIEGREALKVALDITRLMEEHRKMTIKK
ncbi:MAG: hypothetical protein A2787_06270 [Omnitrophica WOR_2 bacterium RIFCSPHIGHO2_01_FULL_48_9]|nr:MAG: hypothetical protein A3D10_01260 [Omnitrophica WOR_2 bacterium RIFCSPHIGHO2_02_FULL_48_11]OGX34515.1 MAG: hypothetical protein A2787_06270 [Omnitrophica WOR_2 bacterium RIFCSPHIGHO2_01_FULL_48_9]